MLALDILCNCQVVSSWLGQLNWGPSPSEEHIGTHRWNGGEKTSWPSAMVTGTNYDGAPHLECIDVGRGKLWMHELPTRPLFFHPSLVLFTFS